ncbi:MAG: radical SAM protein, partial [Actinomycetota bacterium]|nr:radical SAM protein [Actinomycetota bacterium]
AVDALLARDRVEVSRTVKTGPRTFDVRSAVVSMTAAHSDTVVATVPHAVPAGAAGCAIIRVVVRHTTPAVRPDDILTALRAVADLEPPTSPLVTRLAQGPLRDATAEVADPLAADEKVDGS